jgi:hypothetical protein
MPNSKNTKVKKNTKAPIKKVNHKEHEEELEIIELDEAGPEDGEVEVDDELAPEVLEALKLKNKKPKKAPTETDYIPELERGEFDFDSGGGDEDF